MDKISKSAREKKSAAATVIFEQSHKRWEEEKERLLLQATAEGSEYDRQVLEWEAQKQRFLSQQQEHHVAVEKQKAAFGGVGGLESPGGSTSAGLWASSCSTYCCGLTAEYHLAEEEWML